MAVPLNCLSFVCLAFGFSRVYAQGTAATCGSGFDWMTNSREQSPCLVASWLYVPCYGPGAPSVVRNLHPPGDAYSGPTSTDPSQTTPCDCNTVLYSLQAACGQCQGGGADPWPKYTANCIKTYNRTYPESIPDGTAVPRWAYLDLISNDTQFNLDAARTFALQNLPDVTNTTQTTNTIPVLTSTTWFEPDVSTTIVVVPSAGNSASTQSTQHSDTGALVGGVLGGVLGLFILIAVILYNLRRRQRHIPTDKSVSGSSHPAPVREASNSETTYHPLLKTGGGNIMGPIRLYDPDDPRTYPAPISELRAPNYAGHPQIMS